MGGNGHVRVHLQTLALLCLAGMFVGGCAIGGSEAEARDRSLGQVATQPDSATPELPVTVESADGETVRVEDVSRIVTLRGPISEVIYSVGLGDNVVGRDESTTFDEAAEVPIVTDGHSIAAEALLSLEPSVVLVDTDTGPPEAIAQLRSVGVPVVVFDTVTSFEGIAAHMRAVAAAVGLEAEGATIASKVTEELRSTSGYVRPDGSKPRVAFLYLRGNAGVYLLGGPGSGADAMIAAAGGIDVGTDMGLKRAFTPLTSEALVSAAPDILLLTTTGAESVGGTEELLSIPGISQTPAGKNRRIVSIEDGLLYSFGVRTPKTVEAIAERFKALDASPHGEAR